MFWWSRIETEEAPAKSEEVPAVLVGSHPFSPGTAVGFHRAHEVGVERSLGRQPFAAPESSSVVDDDGSLRAVGLLAGDWCAVGQVGDRHRYVQFPIV